MEARIQGVSIVAAGILLFVILELVRRRRLMERYALVWLGSGAILLGLAIWRGALKTLADAIGVFYPPNALFLIAFGFVLVLLLHFSIAVSKLSDQSKLLAQKLALLEQRVDAGREEPLPLRAADDDEPAEPAAGQLRQTGREASVVGRRDVLDP